MILMHSGGMSGAYAVAIGTCINPHAKHWRWDNGAAGHLKKLLGQEVPWYNLYSKEPDKWDRQDARSVAKDWCLTNEKRRWTLLLLGAKVCDAFGIEDPEWLGWYSSLLWSPMIAVPHPSGLNRWYNDAANKEAAQDLLHQVAQGKLPEFHKQRVTKEDS